MAYTANIVTVVEMQNFAGANVGAAGADDPFHTVLQDYAEAYLSILMKFDVATNFTSGMNATYKILVTEWAARFAGNAMIQDDMSGYTDGIEAENMVKINAQRMLDIEDLLLKADKKDFMGPAI